MSSKAATGRAGPTASAAPAAVDLYLDLLARSLTGLMHLETSVPVVEAGDSSAMRLARKADWVVGKVGLTLHRPVTIDAERRGEGRDWPRSAQTMVGMKRLANARWCIERVLEDEVPGDIMETGVWRGGASIFMTGVLAAYGATDREVWLADSFQGLPKPDTDQFVADAGDKHHAYRGLAIGLEVVKANFEKYGLLGPNVRFLPGWFRDTLPTAPVETLSVLRLDGDMYESTMVALESLYPKLSPGGFCIVDDYGALEQCRKAVSDYRDRNGITAEIEIVDWTGAFWRKTEA
jgi:O-methyltransferase